MKVLYNVCASSGSTLETCDRHSVGDGRSVSLSTVLLTRMMPTSLEVVIESIWSFCCLKRLMSTRKSSSVRSFAWYAAAKDGMSCSPFSDTISLKGTNTFLNSSTFSNAVAIDSFTSETSIWCLSSSMSSASVEAVSPSLPCSRTLLMSSSFPMRRDTVESMSMKPPTTLSTLSAKSSGDGSKWSTPLLRRISTTKRGTFSGTSTFCTGSAPKSSAANSGAGAACSTTCAGVSLGTVMSRMSVMDSTRSSWKESQIM
mmetsp:Transcript_23996/g.78068  ORF Transcript_23996/g.78068 Transcript_23996/m.78068 type:complete len:257 (-) Transcript_23996:1273-2043(-)